MTFDEFFRSHYLETVRLAHLLTGSNSSAEDVAQDAFARVHPKYESLENPGGYLRTATVNLCRNRHRGKSREARYLEQVGPSTTETLLESDEILDAVDVLPHRQRAVVILRYWLDLRESDIAAVLDCRPGTVKSLHDRALKRLRKGMPQ